MPFGLCTAPYTFTKILKPVSKRLRKEGIKMVIYLDILFIANTEAECREQIQRTRIALESLGFIINNEKSQLEPSQQCVYLGLVLDSYEFCIHLPEKKINTIEKIVTESREKRKWKIRELAQLIDTLVLGCPAVKFGWVYTKRFERDI